MLSKEDFAVIKALNKRGVYQKDIAEQLGVHPKTVSRALKRGKAPVRAEEKAGMQAGPVQADSGSGCSLKACGTQ